MSWAAMNYVRRLKRESGVVGNLRLLAIMIAWRIPTGHIESRPVSRGALARDTGLDRKTVRGLLKKVIATGLVRIGAAGRGRGRYNTYLIPNLAGPLFMVSDESEKGGESPPFFALEKGGDSPPFPDDEKGGDSPHLASKRGAIRPNSVRTCTSKDVRTKTTTTARKPVAAVTYETALDFLDWFAGAYPAHHQGAQVTVSVEADGPVVVELLTTPCRTVERLQAMALAMWTVTAGEDPWLVRADDRGLLLLRHAADRLDRIVSAREAGQSVRSAACHYRHEPPCSSMAACLEREKSLVAAREATG